MRIKTIATYITVITLIVGIFTPLREIYAAQDNELKTFLIEIKALKENEAFLPDQNIIVKDLIKWTLLSIGLIPTASSSTLCKENLSDDEKGLFETAIRINSISYSPSERKCNPQKVASRIEGVMHVLTVYGIPVPKLITLDINVSDVNKNGWVAPWVKRVLDLKLLSPKRESRFVPFGKMTRRETSELIFNTSNYLKSFTDGTKPEIEIIIQSNTEKTKIPHSDILVDVWQQITDNYLYYDEKIGKTPDEFAYEAIKGLVHATNDKYGDFASPEEDLISGTTDSFGGIGAVLDQDQNLNIVIVNVLQGNPAEKAGLKTGDIIKEVDGKSVEGIKPQEAARLIRGKEGTSVELIIEREGKTKKFAVVRATIEIRPLNTHEIDKDIMRINIGQFEENLYTLFDETIKILKEKNYKGYIIDVRNNPGGFVDSTVKILGHFIPKGETVLFLKRRKGNIEKQISPGPGDLGQIPIVILVNEGSASAAEIFAAALQDHKRAKIVGTKTFGKGTAQELTRYESGESFKITVAEWLSPEKKPIDETGVIPDIIVENTEAEKDAQLEKAIQEIKKQINSL